SPHHAGFFRFLPERNGAARVHRQNSPFAGSLPPLMILHGPYRADLLRAETLPDILEATIRRHPAAIAIHWQDQTLTYDMLGQRADLAAHHLIEAGVRPGQVVGLCLPRGAELLV